MSKGTIICIGHNWNFLPLRPYNTGLYLSKLGYNIKLLIPNKSLWFKTKVVNLNFTIYLCPTILGGGFKKGSDPFDFIFKIWFILTHKYDLIYAFDSRPTVIIPAIIGKKLRGRPLILDWTDWFGGEGIIKERSGKLYQLLFRRIETFFEEGFRNYANASTVICFPLKQRLLDLGYRKEIYYYPLGCNKFPEIKSIMETKLSLGFSAEKKIIGCVGSLLKSDAELLFKSFSIVKKQINVDLVLIGENNLAKQYPIPRGIITTGKLNYNDLLAYIHSCDLMVIPLKNNVANNGRWPSKINEYLTMRKPVVTTEISVLTELMKIYIFGLTSKDSAEDFAAKIILLINDERKKEEYGFNAGKISTEILSWSKIASGLDHFIEDNFTLALNKGL